MNEPINKLFGQALDEAITETWTTLDTDQLNRLKEKFAQLIVQECVQTLINNTPERYTNESAEEDWDKGYDRAMKDCVHHIKEHFGINK